MSASADNATQILDAAHAGAANVFSDVLHWGETAWHDWQAVEANPAFKPLIDGAAATAKAELAANHVPVGELVDIGGAILSLLRGMAQASPGIDTTALATAGA